MPLPVAMAASVRMLHGATTMRRVTNEPLEMAAPKSSGGVDVGGQLLDGIHRVGGLVSNVWIAHLLITRWRRDAGVAQPLEHAHAVDDPGGAGQGDDEGRRGQWHPV